MTQRRASPARGTRMVVAAHPRRRPVPLLVVFCGILLLLFLFERQEQCVTDAFLLPGPHFNINSRLATSPSHAATRIRSLSSRGPLYERTTSKQTATQLQRRRPASAPSTSKRRREHKPNDIDDANYDNTPGRDTPSDFNHPTQKSVQFGKQDPDGRCRSSSTSTSSSSSSIKPTKNLIRRLWLVVTGFLVSALILGKNAAHAKAEIGTVYDLSRASSPSSLSAVSASTRSGWHLQNSLPTQTVTLSSPEPVQSALGALGSWIQSSFGAIFGHSAVVFSSAASTFRAILSAFQSLWTDMAKIKARSTVASIFGAMLSPFRSLWTAIANTRARSSVASIFGAMLSPFQSLWAAMANTKASSFVASIFGAILSPFQSLWTAMANTKARSLLSAISSHMRRILWTALALLTARALVQQQQTRRRQVQDATSEWSRYARHPAARVRAIGTLLMIKLLPLLLVMRIVTRRGSERRDRFQQRAGGVLADNLLKLGPLYIKLGQILSCREKLLPQQWKDALEKLQDQVPSQSGERAQQLAYEAWPGGENSFHETFVGMDWTPVAAASLGQVHTAKLKTTGEPVALKLQRPFLREIYDQDFALLTKIASIVDKYFGSSAGSVGGVQQSWTEIFDDAEEILYREIDYRDEAENAIRWYKAFGLTKGGKPAAKTEAKSLDGKPLPSAAPWLRTPYVYDELSTEKVLVMENVPSIKITNSAELDAANVTALDREYLADCLGRSYLRQFCCNRFFSTDPHAGNLGVEVLNKESSVQEERVRLVYYDFGQAADLQQNQADGILDIIEAIVDMDVDRSIESFQKMDVLKEGADLSVVRAKVADNYRTGKVKANRKKLRKRGYKFKVEADSSSNSTNSSNTTATTTSGSSDAAVMQYFTLPAEYAFVARALSQMDGVGKSLDPEFDFVSSAAPWIVEIKGAGLYVKDEALKWITNVRDLIGIPKAGRKISMKHHGDGRQPKAILVPPLQTAVAVALVFLVSATRFLTGAEKSDDS